MRVADGLDFASRAGLPARDLVVRTLDAVWTCERRSLRVSVYFCGDREIAELHRKYLGESGPTDVISFPLDPLAHAAGVGDAEIVVSVDTAVSRARVHRNSVVAELALYLVHGALHLIGYDDRDAITSRSMRCAEQRVLARLGLEVQDRDP